MKKQQDLASISKLPSHFNPRKPANQDREIIGRLPLSQFSRIESLVEQAEEDLVMSVMVTYEDGQLHMRGNIKTEFIMQCQRCLQLMPVPIDSSFDCVIVASEEASKALPPLVDGYVCEETINLSALAEDELILAIPMSPKHEHCEAEIRHINDSSTQDSEATHNPFADLKDLIKPN